MIKERAGLRRAAFLRAKRAWLSGARPARPDRPGRAPGRCGPRAGNGSKHMRRPGCADRAGSVTTAVDQLSAGLGGMGVCVCGPG